MLYLVLCSEIKLLLLLLLPPILAGRRLMGASLALSTFFAMQTATGGAALPVLIHSRFAALISCSAISSVDFAIRSQQNFLYRRYWIL